MSRPTDGSRYSEKLSCLYVWHFQARPSYVMVEHCILMEKQSLGPSSNCQLNFEGQYRKKWAFEETIICL